jgi:GMP synthase-like glutamine amidotransferase
VHVIAFRHVPFEGAGRIEPVLASHGISLVYADLYQPDAPVPDISHAAGLIVLGGPMSANDDLPWLRAEERLIQQAIQRGQPVLGICLGSQLIAKALGAQVHPNQEKEIGWFKIHFTDSARQDPLLAGLPASETVFHWHGESFDLPKDAVLLASSERCRHQVYRVGSSVYGLQCHLEVTPEMIADWCTQDANCGDVRELATPPDPTHNLARTTEMANLVFGRWCVLVRT